MKKLTIIAMAVAALCSSCCQQQQQQQTQDELAPIQVLPVKK